MWQILETNKRIRWGVGAIMLAAASGCGHMTAGPVRGKFTVGKETTIVEGPLKADGTVDYIAAMNEINGRGVTPEDNAAIPLLTATTNENSLPFNKGLLDELKIPTPTDAMMLHFLSVTAKRA